MTFSLLTIYLAGALFCAAAWWLGITVALIRLRARLGYSLQIMMWTVPLLLVLSIVWPLIAFKNMVSEAMLSAFLNLHETK